MLDFETSSSNQVLTWGLEIKLKENYFFLENYVTSEGDVSHNVLYNLSPLLVFKKGFMMIIILSDYP